MGNSNSFIKNSFLTLSRQLLGIIFVFVTLMIIARTLGPVGQGKYSLAILLPNMLAIFFNLGIGPASVYYVGKKQIDLDSLFKTNVISGLGLSVVAYSVGLVVVLFFSDQLFSSIPSTVLLTVLLVLPFLFMKLLLQAIFQGTQDFKAFNAIILIGQGTTLVLVFIFLIILDAGLIEALISFVAGQVMTVITVIFLLKKRLSIKFKAGKFNPIYFKKSLTYGIKAHFSNILAFVNYRADIFMISFFLSPAAVGFYAIAVNIAERLWVVSQAISSVLLPRISSSNDEQDKNNITSTISRNVFTASIIGGFIFFLISDLFIKLFFGNAYEDSSIVLKLLLPGIILGSMARILSNDFAGRGKPEINLYTSIFTVIANISLNILLIPLYGINGAAIATSITYSINWLIKIIIFNRMTGMPFWSFLVVQTSDFKLYLKMARKLKAVTRGAN
jgi:O-antigen/teichoic acid export membrane protein